MSATPPVIDWSATAAWVALIVSIVGTIAGPLITSVLNNRHQRKMYILQTRDKQISAANDARRSTLEKFLADVGKFIAYPDDETAPDFGSSYFPAYQYIPDKYWELLDTLYKDVVYRNLDSAKSEYQEIIHVIAEILKEPLQ